MELNWDRLLIASWAVLAPVPPFAIGSMPETKVEEAKLTAPDDNPPRELEKTTPDPRVENTAAEDTDKVPPTPTLPEVLSPAREVSPATFNEESRLTPEVTVSDEPKPTLPEVLRVDKLVLPVTAKDEDRLVPELTVKLDPIPTLPDTFKEDPMPTKPLRKLLPAFSRL